MDQIIELVSMGGDSGLLIAFMGFGYHRVTNRLTAIESCLKAKREIRYKSEDRGIGEK